nr:MAG TPA: hypothetical protein [Caudoviricetes sp.]
MVYETPTRPGLTHRLRATLCRNPTFYASFRCFGCPPLRPKLRERAKSKVWSQRPAPSHARRHEFILARNKYFINMGKGGTYGHD